MAYIEAAALRKTYRVAQRVPGKPFRRDIKLIEALQDVSFTIDRGEAVGLIGPNGAGKSTLVKVISGILVPTAGACAVEGRVPWRERRRHVAQLGCVFGQRSQLWWDVPVEDSLDLLRDIYAVPAGQYARTRARLSEALELEPLLRMPVRQLSLGQRMRCELAAALLHSPRLLLLDEPTIGLDAVTKLAVRSFLKEWMSTGECTLLLTTHDMADIQALCPRALVIGHGRLLFDGAMRELEARYDTARVVRAMYSDESVEPHWEGIEDLRAEGRGWRVTLSNTEHPRQLSALLRALEDAGELRDLVMEPVSVDEMIAGMYRELAL